MRVGTWAGAADLQCSRMLWDALGSWGCQEIPGEALGSFGMLRFSRILHDHPGFARMLRDAPGDALGSCRMLGVNLRSSRMLRDAAGHLGML